MAWNDILNELRTNGFSSPWKDAAEPTTIYSQRVTQGVFLEESMHALVTSANPNPYWYPYVKEEIDSAPAGQGTPDYSTAQLAQVPDAVGNAGSVISDMMGQLFTTMNNPHHPTFQANVLPPTTIVGTVGAITGMKLNPNIIDEHYSLNVAKAEMELWSMLGNLLSSETAGEWPTPWSPPAPASGVAFQMDSVPVPGSGSGGIITFGGTGCYFYAIKYALTKVANSKPSVPPSPDSRKDGIEQGRFVFMTSNQGHYCYSNISDWCGMGYGSVIKIQTLPDNTMDPNDLLAKMEQAKSDGKIVVAVVGTFGTTDAGAFDDLETIRGIIDGFDNADGYRKPFLYADSVIGWVWLFFLGYDFVGNPLGFEPTVLATIQNNAEKVVALAKTDAFGIDFHKTGFTHYASSMVMFRDYGDFATTMQRGASPYLQPEQYDPGLYTLETSRSSVGSAGPWATVKYLGKDGMRTLSYNLRARQEYLRAQLQSSHPDFAICNGQNYLYATLMRIYPAGTTEAQAQYEIELSDQRAYDVLKAHNELQRAVYVHLYTELRAPTSLEFYRVPHPSLTTGFRYTYYNPEGTGEETPGVPMQGIFALKSFVSTPFVDDDDMQMVLDYIILARDTLTQQMIVTNLHWAGPDVLVLGDIPAGADPYNHLIVAKHIPTKYLVPKGYDFKSDPELEMYLAKLKLDIALTRARIERLVHRRVR